MFIQSHKPLTPYAMHCNDCRLLSSLALQLTQLKYHIHTHTQNLNVYLSIYHTILPCLKTLSTNQPFIHSAIHPSIQPTNHPHLFKMIPRATSPSSAKLQHNTSYILSTLYICPSTVFTLRRGALCNVFNYIIFCSNCIWINLNLTICINIYM